MKGMRIWFWVCITGLCVMTPAFAQNGIFENKIDYKLDGSEKPDGTVSFTNSVYHIEGGGADYAGKQDEGFFVYTEREGSWRLQGKFVWIDAAQAFARCGIMLREDAQSSSSKAYFASIRNELITTWAGYRSDQGGDTNWFQYKDPDGNPAESPVEGLWVRLTRIAPEKLVYVELSTDGKNWFFVHETSLDMAAKVAYGLAIESHTQDSLAVTEVSDVKIQELSSYGIRSFSSKDYMENDTILATVSINNLTKSPVTQTVQETVPEGWSISNISNDGTAAAGVITWKKEFPAGITKLTYKVTPKASAQTVVLFKGTIDSAPTLGLKSLPKALPAAGVLDRAIDWYLSETSAKAAGSISVKNDIYEIQGSGSDIEGNADEGFFAYKVLSGDWSVEGKLKWVDYGEEIYARCGIMLRSEAQNASAMNYFASIRGELVTTWAGYRSKDSGGTDWFQYLDDAGNPLASPEDGMWLRVSRITKDKQLLVESSDDGKTWYTIHQLTMDFPETITCGFAITSHYKRALVAEDFLAKAEISNVKFTKLDTAVKDYMLY